MTRAIHKLSATKVRTNTNQRRLGDGGGLWLNTSASGSKSWVFRWTPKGGRPKEMGLGVFPDLSLADARNLAAEYRNLVALGKDPKHQRDANRVSGITFGEVADEYLESKLAAAKELLERAHGRSATFVNLSDGLPKSSADAFDTIADGVSNGTLSLESAARLSDIVKSRADAIELADLDERLKELESKSQ